MSAWPTDMRIYIGHEPREYDAYQVAVKSLLHRATIPVEITPLDAGRLAQTGLLRRPTDARDGLYDLHSNAPCATGFAISRFLTPILAQTGWALFIDCDVVFMADIAELLQYCDRSKAVMVVKHRYQPGGMNKMDNVEQTIYHRKNWSSVMLWNCDHEANRRLSLQDVQERPGRDLHKFYWLHDSEIGELPPEWNWLVGEQTMPKPPKICHYTLGGPFIPGWAGALHDDIWIREAGR